MFFDSFFIGFLLALIVVVIFFFNRFFVLRQRVNNSWSQIDINLKRRYDLIPNLVDVVREYAEHEQNVFSDVVSARNVVSIAGSLSEKAEAEKELTGTLKSLLAVAENYPELKANSNFIKLQEELAETENKIMFSRQFYNDTVQKYNTKIELFPNNFVAKIFNFKKAEYFRLSEDAVRSSVNIYIAKE